MKAINDLKYILRHTDRLSNDVIEEVFATEQKVLEFEDKAIICLFEDMLGKINSLLILIENNHYFSLQSITRSIFENFIYLSYILKEDTRIRGRSFALSARTDENKLYSLLTERGKVGRKVRSFIGMNESDIAATFDESKINFDIRLSVFSDVLMLRKEKSKWYDLNQNKSITNIEQLCNELNLEGEYNLVYRMFSREVHSSDVMSLFDIQEIEDLNLKEEKNDGSAPAYVHIKKQKIEDSLLPVLVSTRSLVEATKTIYSYYELNSKKVLFETNVRLKYRMK
ncbi:DUF5677 domain-containing protein [Sporosarcina sp.]|uniref:DUF5677 domain-containing protein n=1 Tax=Sporosarcina sp. TaxID=49982 RepID=UPI00260DA985|nr:DUF5677 domain-containing protein [Sporosarcina sp.]